MSLSWFEIAGFVAGAACVWLYVRQSVWAWPVGIANSASWLVLFWGSRLYLDAGLQVVYIGLGVAGWFWWLRGGPRRGELPVTRTRPREALALAAVGLAGILALWRVMVAVGDAAPLADAATTVTSLIAQYMLTRKLLASWWCWIAVDIAYVVLYAGQGLYLTAALQPLFIAMCLIGWWRWRAALHATSEAGAVPVAVAPVTLGVVIGKFLPPHRGHSYLIESACAAAGRVVVIVCERGDDPIPAGARAAVLRELHPAATVVITPDDIPDGQGEVTSRRWAARTVELLGGRAPDLVFTSEEYGDRYARFLGARHVAVDPARRRFPVSGTTVRCDPWGNTRFLAPAVRAWFVRRVCVLGAESTGTTTLARDLAAHYGCAWVPEYGRTWCEQRLAQAETIGWRSEDFVEIARGQQADEDAAARRGGRLLICDTDALATSVWHERYLGRTSPEVALLAAARGYTLYVLTGDEIPFVQDGTRDGEHVRGWMTGRFRQVLSGRAEPWLEVRGSRRQRMEAAVARIDGLLSEPWRYR